MSFLRFVRMGLLKEAEHRNINFFLLLFLLAAILFRLHLVCRYWLQRSVSSPECNETRLHLPCAGESAPPRLYCSSVYRKQFHVGTVFFIAKLHSPSKRSMQPS